MSRPAPAGASSELAADDERAKLRPGHHGRAARARSDPLPRGAPGPTTDGRWVVQRFGPKARSRCRLTRTKGIHRPLDRPTTRVRFAEALEQRRKEQAMGRQCAFTCRGRGGVGGGGRGGIGGQ